MKNTSNEKDKILYDTTLTNQINKIFKDTKPKQRIQINKLNSGLLKAGINKPILSIEEIKSKYSSKVNNLTSNEPRESKFSHSVKTSEQQKSVEKRHGVNYLQVDLNKPNYEISSKYLFSQQQRNSSKESAKSIKLNNNSKYISSSIEKNAIKRPNYPVQKALNISTNSRNGMIDSSKYITLQTNSGTLTSNDQPVKTQIKSNILSSNPNQTQIHNKIPMYSKITKPPTYHSTSVYIDKEKKEDKAKYSFRDKPLLSTKNIAKNYSTEKVKSSFNENTTTRPKLMYTASNVSNINTTLDKNYFSHNQNNSYSKAYVRINSFNNPEKKATSFSSTKKDDKAPFSQSVKNILKKDTIPFTANTHSTSNILLSSFNQRVTDTFSGSKEKKDKEIKKRPFVDKVNLNDDPDKKTSQLNIKEEDKKVILPTDGHSFIAKYRAVLTKDEQEEISLLHDKIYYLGGIEERINPADKLKSISPASKQKNEEEEGAYSIILGSHIFYRYEILNDLGKGSFGQAVKCFDHKHKKQVCVKIIRNNNKKFTTQAKIEIRILQYINTNDVNEESNVIKMINNFNFRGHVCIVFELLDMNLYELLKYQDFNGLDMNVIRKIAIQLLYTLIFLQKSRIIHCDLKPENVLLKSFGKTGIKVIDFGSSCFEGEKLYSYIQSRFYRAPEIILGLDYGLEIDMWSFGCIIVELFTGIPIFPGENEKDQINYIMEYFGKPADDLIKNAKKKHYFFEYVDSQFVPLKHQNSRGKIRNPNTKKLEKFLNGADEGFINLVRQCLEWDPNKRIKPDEAILNEWITLGMPPEIYDFHKKNYEARIKSRIGDTGGNYIKPKEDSGVSVIKTQLSMMKKDLNPLYKSSKY